MTGRLLLLRPRAERDIEEALAYYRKEGGHDLALRWADNLEHGLRHISRFPASGSPRYANLLGLRDLRHWPTDGFPYLIFYLDTGQGAIDVWRVLHARRDIPGWLHDDD